METAPWQRLRASIFIIYFKFYEIFCENMHLLFSERCPPDFTRSWRCQGLRVKATDDGNLTLWFVVFRIRIDRAPQKLKNQNQIFRSSSTRTFPSSFSGGPGLLTEVFHGFPEPIPPGKFLNNIFNSSTTASIRIYSNSLSLITLQLGAIGLLSELITALLYMS